MRRQIVIVGFAGWLAATLGLRLIGQFLLQPENPFAILRLFGVSLALMALLARKVCEHLPPQQRLSGAVSLMLPTLLLDPFSSAFFSSVFPNINPSAAGLFGGWMLWCCASAIAGVTLRWPHREQAS